jgi:hypothetical protein
MAAKSDKAKAVAPSKIPFLAIEPPPIGLGTFGQYLADFLPRHIENMHREIPDDIGERFPSHGLSFLLQIPVR